MLNKRLKNVMDLVSAVLFVVSFCSLVLYYGVSGLGSWWILIGMISFPWSLGRGVDVLGTPQSCV